ncbi:MAG: hypothetical protein RMM51_03050 [Verrucomicrobiae bacterium]|nr:hypothetical protein [Verrucomicrobiae bacterium]
MEAATTALRLYYERWRELTVAEAEAIRLQRWEAVDRLQQHKQQLQPFIEGIYRELPTEEVHRLQEQFRPVVQELLALEQQNAVAVAEVYRRAQQQADQCRQTERALHRVQDAYAPAQAPTWQTYS